MNNRIRKDDMDKAIYRTTGTATPILSTNGECVPNEEKEKEIIRMYKQGNDVDTIVARFVPIVDIWGERHEILSVKRMRNYVKKVIAEYEEKLPI